MSWLMSWLMSPMTVFILMSTSFLCANTFSKLAGASQRGSLQSLFYPKLTKHLLFWIAQFEQDFNFTMMKQLF